MKPPPFVLAMLALAATYALIAVTQLVQSPPAEADGPPMGRIAASGS